MANPVIVFEVDNGADSNSASGAGPSTAITGTKARAKSGTARVGFFEASAPDLSLVATDGSHALKLGTGSGRQWTKITAKKNTQQSVAGAISASSSTVTGTTTSGMTSGDVVKLPGAGAAAADLYTTINTVIDGVSFSVNDAATTTSGSMTVVNPCQVTVGDTFTTLTSDTAWAIGGQRAVIDGISRFWLDLKPGWTVELRDNQGGSTDVFDVSAQIVLGVSGDTTDGWITIRGGNSSVSAYQPRVSYDTSHYPFALRASLVRFENLGVDSTAGKGLVTLDSSAATAAVFDRIAGKAFTYMVEITSAVLDGTFVFKNCAPTTRIQIDAVKGTVVFDRCYFRAAVSSADTAINVGSFAGSLRLTNCVFYDWSAAVVVTSASHIHSEGCVYDNNGLGLTCSDVASWKGAIVRGNTFSNHSGNALNGASSAGLVAAIADYNNFYANATSRVGFDPGAHDLAVDPQFRNALGDDFRAGIPFRGSGSEQFLYGALAPSASSIGLPVGDPVGGTVQSYVTRIDDFGDSYFVSVHIVDGPNAGADVAVQASKADIASPGAVYLPAVLRTVLAALRDQTPESLIGKTVLS